MDEEETEAAAGGNGNKNVGVEYIGDDDDRHPRYPGRRRNGQARKGYTPNPRGRPPEAQSTKEVFRKMLRSKVTVVIDGVEMKQTVLEALADRVKRVGLTGPLRGLDKAIAVAQQYSEPDRPPREAEPLPDLSLLSDEDLALYGMLSAKVESKPWPLHGLDAIADGRDALGEGGDND